jgi:hypothetical protein
MARVFFSTDIVLKGSLHFGIFTQSCDKREVMLAEVHQYPTLLCSQDRFEEKHAHVIIKVVLVQYMSTYSYMVDTVRNRWVPTRVSVQVLYHSSDSKTKIYIKVSSFLFNMSH